MTETGLDEVQRAQEIGFYEVRQARVMGLDEVRRPSVVRPEKNLFAVEKAAPGSLENFYSQF